MTTITKARYEISDLAVSAMDRLTARKARLVAKQRFQDGSRPDAEPHRQRGLARLKAATAAAPPRCCKSASPMR